MKAIFKFNVLARLPERLKPLEIIAHNLWFSWHHDIGDLYGYMDADLWDKSNHNPVRLLGDINQARLEELGKDDGFLKKMDQAHDRLVSYLSEYNKTAQDKENARPLCVAYLSAEFGLTQCLPIYSGGLGILSGDHLKSASDLGLPLVGVGLFYHEGFFQQYLNADGWQQEAYPENDVGILPMALMRNENGQPILVDVQVGHETVKIQIWRVMVGRIPLYLLDTNLEENPTEQRHITARLYGGDWDMRIRQEIVLGVGGVRALRALGIEPTVFHMNEGHSAFSALERIRILKEERNLSFDAAREFVVASNAFTTHTPVPAGNDMFAPDLLHRYFENYVHSLGIAFKVFLGFGRQDPMNEGEPFSMTVLALRLSSHANGVSKLHSKVSQNMWHRIWPKNPVEDIPIIPITNGVHIPSYTSKEMASLFDRYLGPHWIEDPDSKKVWQKVEKIPDADLWQTHEKLRARLVAFTRKSLEEQLQRCGVSGRDLDLAAQVLDPEILTIGFARRFATYKRATLLLSDEQRLIKLLTDEERPIQIILAGKAHPHDNEGKELIRQFIHFVNRPEVRNRFVFLQNYNINVAKMLLRGCDVWLNTPRRPLEACGTSGMKGISNGVLNMSTLDGWWDEGYTRDFGWAVGRGETYDDHELQDEVESRDIYNTLEREVIPLFYERGKDNLPEGWIKKMKAAMTHLCPVFHSHRMVEDYANQFYSSISDRYHELAKEDMSGAKELAQWRQHIMTNWDQIRINRIHVDDSASVPVSGDLKIEADVYLHELQPDDIDLDIYFGPLTFEDTFTERQTIAMSPDGNDGNGNFHFEGHIPCSRTGKFGFTIRIMPTHRKMETPYSTGLVIWAHEGAIAE